MGRGVIAAYRLEWKPADWVYTSPKGFEQTIMKDGARIWALYTMPQPGCPNCIELYSGPHFIQPKHVYCKCLDGFTPLYLGPIIHDPWAVEMAWRKFPLMRESARRDH